jgi:hypothetical protein
MKRLFPLLLAIVTLAGCPKDEVISAPFTEDFERAELGSRYYNTGGPYRIVSGKLKIQGAYNHPLWLKKRLPRNAEITFDVTSDSAVGDIKVEAWGDGKTFATTKGAYMASSYVFIFGGWGNSTSALCRMDEHADNRKTRSDVKVVKGQTYNFRIRREGKFVQWFVDGNAFLEMEDPSPLEGEEHSYFGFNNWESDLTFDNLVIKPL